MILRVIYTLLIGIFLAVFVGVGISAFYEGPKYPDMPAILKFCFSEISQSQTQFSEFKIQAEKFDKEEKAYQKESELYNRNVSILSLIGSIIIVVASLTLLKKIYLMADGLLLGGVLTLLYSVARGFGTADNKFRFLVVSVGLALSLILGYIKFIHKNNGKSK